MTTSISPADKGAKPDQTGRYKRSARNYLIDSRFQLKYTGLFVLGALVISAALFTFLWRTSREVVDESQKVSEQSRKAVEESQKVSDVVKMGINKDPFYNDDPELLKAFTEESSKQDKTFADQQDHIAAQQAKIAAQQSTMLATIAGSLLIMVAFFGVMGIYFTHKVAGPIFKMKRLLRQVGEGKLMVESRLRKGDELQEFFETFATMVEGLRARQQQEIDELDRAIALAKQGGANDQSLAKIALVRDEMKRALEA